MGECGSLSIFYEERKVLTTRVSSLFPKGKVLVLYVFLKLFCAPSFPDQTPSAFWFWSCLYGGEGNPSFTKEPTNDEIGTSLEQQLVLTDREKVGVVIGAFAISDHFVGFIYGLIAKVLMPHEVNRDAFIKNFSSLWKGNEDVSIKEIAHNRFWVWFYVTVIAVELLTWNHGPIEDPWSCWRRS
ncbi:unnamed protein product [Prunus armeniaca]|uniref:Uncharacterized protein n=1 Tax=Prunus armeniaca TaxID=36596 RepID=A0A6J5TWZ6_PRUAR|nr:unnamed protein product [Prunus armeniaca]